MNKEKENNNKRKLMGTLAAFLFGVFTLVIIFAFSLDIPENEEKPVQLIEFDYSGSTKKGGSSSSEKASTPQEVSEPAITDPVKTQKTESPVKKTSTKKTNTTSTPTQKVNDRAIADGSMFGNNKGSGKGTNDGNGDGLGDGEDGPGVTGKSGPLSRKAISRPELDNPINETGKVAVEITVDRTGRVVSAKALRTHPYTTSNNPAHYAAAEKAAMQCRFSASSSAKEFEIGIEKFNFILN